jgi:hypothetical protein
VLRVDADLFEVLVELRHPCTAVGLLRLAGSVDRMGWIEAQAAELCPAPPRARALTAAAEAVCTRRATAARAELAAVFPDGPGASAGIVAWAGHLGQRRSELGAQLVPRGWMAEREPPER